MTQSFSEAISWSRTEPGKYENSIDKDWFQGRGAFGGIAAAAAVRAMDDTVDSDEHRIRSLGVQFCGPLVASPAVMSVEIVRRGSSVINAEARIEQDGEVKTTATATFTKQRHSKSDFERLSLPEVPSPEEVATAPHSPLFPKFASFYEYKFCVGEIPFTGSDEAAVGGWCRLRDAEEPVDAAQAAALLDLWPPAVLTRMDSPTAAATISWQVLFNDPLPLKNAGPEDFYLVSAKSNQTVGGYAEESAELWSSDGRRLAQAIQLVAIFG